MCTRSMNLGCFCVVFFDLLMFPPFMTKTVEHGSFSLACGEGCFSTKAKLVPWQVFRLPEEKRGSKEPARAAWARGCT
jgi:hypothetical protein